MQTILGSGGAIGVQLAKALSPYTQKIRLVSRNPKKVNPDDELFPANVLNPDELQAAIKGSRIVYVTVGFKYDHKVWQESWPKFMHATIQVCKAEGCKLVFIDNIYMYDPACLGALTEETPVMPTSRKGRIRAHIADMLLTEMKSGQLDAIIARSADFYGPGIQNTSMLTETVFKNYAKGKKAMWMGPLKFRHAFTYTPDAGKALALLGNTSDAFNQVWHLPTADNPLTGQEWVDAIAREMQVPARVQTIPKVMLSILGIFVPIMREMVEMSYQWEGDYIFDSTKFKKHFDFTPTAYIDGIKEITKADYHTPTTITT